MGGKPGLADVPVEAAPRPGLEPPEAVIIEPSEMVDEKPEESREPLETEVVEKAEEDGRVLVTISARFVDDAGRPIAGVELSASSIADSPVAVSDGTGLAELVLDWEELRGFSPQPCSFEMRGPGLFTVNERQWFGKPEDRFLGEYPMLPGGAVRGRVVDPEGRGVADAVLQVIFPVLVESAERDELRIFGGLPARSPRTRSQSAGSFVLEGLYAMPLSITAQGKGTFFAISEPVTIEAGATLDIGELVVEPAPADQQIGGVLRTESGESVKGASIRLLDEGRDYIHGRVLTDELGGFRFTVAPGRRYALQILDYSSNGWPDINVDAIEPGTLDLEAVFEGTRSLLVRVTGPDGRPVRRFQASITGLDNRVIPGGSGLSEEGEPVTMKVPASPFHVVIRAPGYEYVKQSFSGSAVGEEVTITLERAAGLAGRVTAGGQPVAGASVHAHTTLDEGRKGLAASVFHVGIDPNPSMGDRTGAEGEFFLNLPGPGRFYVHADAEGFARAEYGPIDFDTRVANAVLELERGGAVEGRVLVHAGIKLAGRVVALSRGDGHFETAVTDAEGAYRFDDLTPGPWQIAEVEEYKLERRRLAWIEADEETSWDLDVVAGETKRFDLDATDEVACLVEGRFVVDGEPPVGWMWAVPRVRGLYRKPFDSEGGFEFEVDEPGSYAVQLIAPRTPGAFCGARLQLELFAGLNSWEGSVETGTLELTGVAAPALDEFDFDGQIKLAYTLLSEQAHGLTWFGNVFAAQAGKLRLLRVPAGGIQVFKGDHSRIIGGPEPTPLLEIDLAPGETRTVALD